MLNAIYVPFHSNYGKYIYFRTRIIIEAHMHYYSTNVNSL